MTEIWKDIKGFEGIYQISNKGNVRSLKREQLDNLGRLVHYQGKTLTPQPNSNGYLRIELKANGKKERRFIHRLVALHFIENSNPDINTVVNHIDNDYKNNNAENLEWTTYKGNTQHAIKSGKMKRTPEWLEHLRKANEKNGKAVIAIHTVTGEKIFFKCLNDCSQKGFQPSCVSNCCKGIRQTHQKYKWHFATPDELMERRER